MGEAPASIKSKTSDESIKQLAKSALKAVGGDDTQHKACVLELMGILRQLKAPPSAWDAVGLVHAITAFQTHFLILAGPVSTQRAQAVSSVVGKSTSPFSKEVKLLEKTKTSTFKPMATEAKRATTSSSGSLGIVVINGTPTILYRAGVAFYLREAVFTEEIDAKNWSLR